MLESKNKKKLRLQKILCLLNDAEGLADANDGLKKEKEEEEGIVHRLCAFQEIRSFLIQLWLDCAMLITNLCLVLVLIPNFTRVIIWMTLALLFQRLNLMVLTNGLGFMKDIRFLHQVFVLELLQLKPLAGVSLRHGVLSH